MELKENEEESLRTSSLLGALPSEKPKKSVSGDSSEEQSDYIRRSKRRRRSFVSPSKIIGIFEDLPPTQLCRLAESRNDSPSEVLLIVRKATSSQLCKYFALTDELAAPAAGDSDMESSRDLKPGVRRVGKLKDLAPLLAELKQLKNEVGYT